MKIRNILLFTLLNFMPLNGSQKKTPTAAPSSSCPSPEKIQPKPSDVYKAARKSTAEEAMEVIEEIELPPSAAPTKTRKRKRPEPAQEPTAASATAPSSAAMDIDSGTRAAAAPSSSYAEASSYVKTTEDRTKNRSANAPSSQEQKESAQILMQKKVKIESESTQTNIEPSQLLLKKLNDLYNQISQKDIPTNIHELFEEFDKTAQAYKKLNPNEMIEDIIKRVSHIKKEKTEILLKEIYTLIDGITHDIEKELKETTAGKYPSYADAISNFYQTLSAKIESYKTLAKIDQNLQNQFLHLNKRVSLFKIDKLALELRYERMIRKANRFFIELMREIESYKKLEPDDKAILTDMENLKQGLFTAFFAQLKEFLNQITRSLKTIHDKPDSDTWKKNDSIYRGAQGYLARLLTSTMFETLYESYATDAQKNEFKEAMDSALSSSIELLVFLEKEMRETKFEHFKQYMQISQDHDQLHNIAYEQYGIYSEKSDLSKKRKEFFDLRQKVD